jgi:hypothetical protein
MIAGSPARLYVDPRSPERIACVGSTGLQLNLVMNLSITKLALHCQPKIGNIGSRRGA